MRRDLPRKTGGFSTLGPGPGQFFARCCRACPDRPACGVDISAAACAIARDNLAALGLEARGFIVCGDWAQRRSAAVSKSSFPIRPMSRAARSLAWSRRFAIMIRVWPSMEAKMAWRPIAKSFRPCLDLLAPGGLIALELGAGQHRSAVESLVRGTFWMPG